MAFELKPEKVTLTVSVARSGESEIDAVPVPEELFGGTSWAPDSVTIVVQVGDTVGVAVAVAVFIGVPVPVLVGVDVLVRVGVLVAVFVGVDVLVRVGVFVAVAVDVGVDVFVDVDVFVAVGAGVFVLVDVAPPGIDKLPLVNDATGSPSLKVNAVWKFIPGSV